MTLEETLRQLESLGNEKVRAQNWRQGVGDNQFGVKLGDIRKIAARIKRDDQLALSLWKTGNLEARLVAILLLEPETLSFDDVDRMVREIDCAQLAEWFSSYQIKEHPEKEALRVRWMQEADRWAARAGWGLTAGRVARKPEGIDIPALLDRIEREMPTADAAVQWTMNTCLANIGIHHAQHRARALEIGERLGIYRDYPVSKGCTSPFAPIWIREMVGRGG